MQRLIEKPHLIFFSVIPLILLYGFIGKDSALDINIHDTYFVIAYSHLTILISMLFGIIGFGYWIITKLNRKLSKWLNLIHITFTFGGILLIWILVQFFRESIWEYNFNNKLIWAIYVIVFAVILGQMIYTVNIIKGIIKKQNKISS